MRPRPESRERPGPREGRAAGYPGGPRKERGAQRPGGASRPGARARPGPHLTAVLLLLLQHLGNRGHGDAGLERGRLGVRGEKRLGRRHRRGASQGKGRPRPRLRQPPCPTAEGSLEIPPPSQQPRERRAAPPRAPPGRPPPSPLPSILEPGKEATRGPTLAPGHPEAANRRAALGTRKPRSSSSEARLKKGRAPLCRRNLLLSQRPRWRRALTSRDLARERNGAIWRRPRSRRRESSPPTERRRMDEAGGPGIGAGHERRSACWGRRAWAGPSLRAKRGTDERTSPRGRSRAEASGGHRLLRYLPAGRSLL